MTRNPRRRDPTGSYRERVEQSDAYENIAGMLPGIGTAMTFSDIEDELKKEEPNYLKIGMLAGTEAIGLIPGLGTAAKSMIRKGADMARQTDEAIDVASNVPKVAKNKPEKVRTTRQVSNTEYDARVSALDSAEDAKTWQTNAEALVKNMRETSPTIRTPELEESAQALRDGKITREQHLKNINTYKPVESWDALPREPSNKATVFSLKPDQRENGRFILPADTTEALGVTQSGLKVGDRFNGRLDIPAYQRFDTWIVAGTSNAEKGVTHYAKAIHYKGVGDNPVRFAASQKKGEKIGTGKEGKTGYATVSGEIKDLDADAIRKKAEALLNDPEWTQVGFDPRRQSSFYVRGVDNRHVPVREADEVIQIGPLVLAKNAKLDKDYAGYAEGGVAMDEQMNAVFKSRRGYALGGDVEIDPVSGNEVPPGSLPEEVRDDIPAMLSEGEYVVPADVLRYYGMKFFEDLREQAKIGMAKMEANGRIGGEPVEVEGSSGISDEDLAAMVQQDLSQTQTAAAQGGLMGFQAGGLNFPEYIKQPDITQFRPSGSDFAGGLEYRVYVNDQGMKITIPFFDGQPMAMIPPGYAPEGQQVKEEVKKVDDSDKGRGKRDPLESDPPDYSNLSTEELESRIQGLKDGSSTEGKIASFIDSIPLIAGLNKLSGKTNTQTQIDMYQAELDSRKSKDDDSKPIVSKDPDFIKAMEETTPKGYTYNPDTGAYTTEDTTPDVSPRPPTRPGSKENVPVGDTDTGEGGTDTGEGGTDAGEGGTDAGEDTDRGGFESWGNRNKGGLMKKKKK